MLARSSLPLFPLWCCAVHSVFVSVMDLLFHVCNTLAADITAWTFPCFQTATALMRTCFMSLLLYLEAVPPSCMLSPAAWWTKDWRLFFKAVHVFDYSLIQRIRSSMFCFCCKKKNQFEKPKPWMNWSNSEFISQASHCCTGCTWWPWMHLGFIISSRYHFPLPVSCLVFIISKMIF